MSKIDVALGIDIGDTNTVLGFVTRTGSVVSKSSIPTNSNESAGHFIARLDLKIKEMMQKVSDFTELKGIGIGAPNANYYRGTIEFPPNLNWQGITQFVKMLNNLISVPIAITNDANAAALGEMTYGAAKGMKNFILIMLGTGFGSGIVVDGKIVYGHDGFAGELGHTIVDVNGRNCGCGRKGCLETYVSTKGICRTVFELLAVRKDSSKLRDVSFNKLTSKMITDAALNGDPIALEAFEVTGKILGQKLADAVTVTSPEAIIFFGGLASAGDLLIHPTKKYMEMFMLNIFKDKVKLLSSQLQTGNTAILGASALIWNELENKKVEMLEYA